MSLYEIQQDALADIKKVLELSGFKDKNNTDKNQPKYYLNKVPYHAFSNVTYILDSKPSQATIFILLQEANNENVNADNGTIGSYRDYNLSLYYSSIECTEKRQDNQFRVIFESLYYFLEQNGWFIQDNLETAYDSPDGGTRYGFMRTLNIKKYFSNN